MDKFHNRLRKSFSWYHNWHNHPRHQHTHWLLFVVLVTSAGLFVSSQIKLFDSENQYLLIPNTAQAQTGPTLGLSGDKFTINGTTKFLLFISYFDAMAASDATLDSDFAALRAKGFDGIRMFTDWNPKDNPYQLMDPSGNIRPGRMAALINVIQKASANNLMVDVSFTRDTVSGLEPNELQAGIVSVTQALMSYRNLYFDITNEADHDGTTCGGGGNARLCPTEARSIRDAVKAVDSQRIVSISPIYGNRQSYIINGGMDFTLAHSALTGMRNEVSQARASTPGLAVHMQEPDRCRTLNSCEYSVNQFLTSASDAKCSGATGWNFHTQAGYDLDNNTIFNQWLDPAVENQVANSLSSTLSGVTWFSCQGAGPTPTPGGGSATGTYRGACPAGYIALAEANASSGDPSETAGYYCDDDGIDPTVVWGVTYPVSGLLVCDNNTSSSNAFVVPSNMWPCNAGRPGNPGWSFDSSGRPLKNGNPVTFIGEHNCGSGGSTPVTITNSNIQVGAWTQNPSTEGLVCIPGTLVTTSPTPTPAAGTFAISSISPNPATEGSTVTITGTRLDQCGPPGPACNVQFHDITGMRSTVSGTTVNPTTVTAVVPTGLCTGTGSVRVGEIDYPTNSIPFTITSGTGTFCNFNKTTQRYIYYITPNRAPVGAPVTISGSNLDSSIYFYDANGTGYRTDGTITGTLNGINVYVDVNVPAGLTPGSYTVQVGPNTADLSNAFPFTITADVYTPDPAPTDLPVITGFSPMTVSQGGTVEIYGNNLPQTVIFSDASGQKTTVLGWVNNHFDILTAGVPINFLPGQYTISVTGPNGSAASTDLLTVTQASIDAGAQATGINVPGSTTTFEKIISDFLTYAVYGLGIAIFVMFLYAGFLWMSSAANPGNIALAKRYMTNTVLGAVILLSSYIILYTINPDLVGGTLTLPKITMQPTTIPPPPPGGGTSQIAAQNLIGVIGLNQFTNANPDCGNPYHARQNIQDVAAGNLPAVCSNQCTNSCTAGGSSGTVNLNPGMLNGLAALWNAGFRFRVTSLSTGSHSPSSSHYQGNGVDIQILFADLTLNTSSAIWQQARNFLNAIDAGAFCEEGDGGSNSSCSPIGSGNAAVDHIHWTY